MIKEDLKYSKEEYEDSGFYDGDMDPGYTKQNEKLVKCRKEHICANCQSTIPSGDYALLESALFPGEGWKSCYTCTKCLDEWLDELHTYM